MLNTLLTLLDAAPSPTILREELITLVLFMLVTVGVIIAVVYIRRAIIKKNKSKDELSQENMQAKK